MPPASRQQQKMIYVLRGKYKNKKKTPKEHKWVWEEGFAEPLDEHKQETYYYYDERYTECIIKIIEDITNGVEEQPWAFVQLPLVKRIWEEFTRVGLIRNEKGLQKIVNRVIDTIIKLDVNCMIWGATPVDPKEEIESLEYHFAKKKPEGEEEKQPSDPDQLFLFKDVQDDIKRKEEEDDYIDGVKLSITWEDFDEKTTDYLRFVSDYGREPLVEIALDLLSTYDSKEQIMLVDKAFNVVHQQYDLTKIFFKNGSSDYSELSGENFDDSSETYIPEYKSFIPMFESPVAINTDNIHVNIQSGNVLAFLYLDGKMHVGTDGMEHVDIITIAHNDYIPYPGENEQDEKLIDWANHQMKYTEIYHSDRVQYAGRCWVDNKIVSFWEEHEKEIIMKIISDLSKHIGIQFDINDWWVDSGFQDTTKRDTLLVRPDEWTGFVNVSTEARSREQEEHIMSPLLKAKKAVPKGFGSNKERPSLKWRQAMNSSESFVPTLTEFINKIDITF